MGDWGGLVSFTISISMQRIIIIAAVMITFMDLSYLSWVCIAIIIIITPQGW